MKNRSPNLRAFTLLAAAVLVLCLGFSSAARAQKVVDKIVATVNDGVKTELITYSDLRWQLALQPGPTLTPPSSEDLNRALQTLIDQRLFSLEAERIPRNDPTDEEIAQEIKETLAFFPSTAEFEKRLRLVGFISVKDDNFVRIMDQRVRIKKYLEFRFRSFTVITPEDEAKYYRETYAPEFRRRNPGVIVPSLEERRTQITQILTEEKVRTSIERFLDDAKRRAEIVVLSEV
jgi:parvulin-like peptidyl-prolyl isomerase